MNREVVLVTGCAGFVGSTLVDTLLGGGREVVGIDAFEAFYPRPSKERNLERAFASSDFRFAEVDTRNADALQRVVSDVRPGAIIDLAARAGVRGSLLDPQLYIDINVTGLQNLLAAAAEVEAPLIFASSSSVYGAQTTTPFHESLTLRPESPYGATKVAGEALVSAHHAITGIPTRVARLFTVYGPRQRPDLAVYKFADALVSGRPIELYDNGRGSRDYTYVDDIVDGLILLAEARQPNLTVNLGRGRPYTTRELLEHLETAFEAQASIDSLPKQLGDVDRTFADVTRAYQELGWTPKVSLADGLARFREWFLAEVKAPEYQGAAPD